VETCIKLVIEQQLYFKMCHVTLLSHLLLAVIAPKILSTLIEETSGKFKLAEVLTVPDVTTNVQ
jgi:hypothetical protein